MNPIRILQLIMATFVRVPERARWSFVDQALVSGVNFLSTILLVRALGLEEFGVFSMVMIGVQFLAGLQGASILGPMMSLYDQRGDVSRSSYLATILLHQGLASACVIVAVLLVSTFAGTVIALPSIDFSLVAVLAVTTQFQDLSRRFFYVTERPLHAFASDLVAYGVRLLSFAALAFSGLLTIDLAWVVIITTSAASLLLMAADFAHLDTNWAAIKKVTDRHKAIAGWMAGNRLVGWFSDSDFFLLVLGSVLGPAALGGVRAVQSIVLVVNLLLQSLENFVPSAATKALVEGGGTALRRYVTDVSAYGVFGISAVVLLLMIFLDPITTLMFKRTFPDALPILVILGTHQALVHVTMVVTAGLRATASMRDAFVAQVAAGAFSVTLVWYPTHAWGVLGALLTLLAARSVLTGLLTLLLFKKAGAIPSPRAS
jgi:O-antigen/teichoic acid export membrane protein